MNADNILEAIRTVYTDSFDNLTDNDKQFLRDKIEYSLAKAYGAGLEKGFNEGKDDIYNKIVKCFNLQFPEKLMDVQNNES